MIAEKIGLDRFVRKIFLGAFDHFLKSTYSRYRSFLRQAGHSHPCKDPLTFTWSLSRGALIS